MPRPPPPEGAAEPLLPDASVADRMASDGLAPPSELQAPQAAAPVDSPSRPTDGAERSASAATSPAAAQLRSAAVSVPATPPPTAVDQLWKSLGACQRIPTPRNTNIRGRTRYCNILQLVHVHEGIVQDIAISRPPRWRSLFPSLKTSASQLCCDPVEAEAARMRQKPGQSKSYDSLDYDPVYHRCALTRWWYSDRLNSRRVISSLTARLFDAEGSQP